MFLFEVAATHKSLPVNLGEVNITAHEELFGFGRTVYNSFKTFFRVYILTVLKRNVKNANKNFTFD